MSKTHWVEKHWQSREGYDCVVLANGIMGHRCGYVGIPSSHPLFCLGYQAVYDKGIELSVHGGLTYSSLSSASDYPVPKDDSERRWWFGFDCCHAGDSPDPAILKKSDTAEAMVARLFTFKGPEDRVRTLEFCIKECESLSQQLEALEATQPNRNNHQL